MKKFDFLNKFHFEEKFFVPVLKEGELLFKFSQYFCVYFFVYKESILFLSSDHFSFLNSHQELLMGCPNKEQKQNLLLFVVQSKL